MNQEKIDFEIIPIFDQMAKPGLWHDFTEIELKCEAEKYGYHVDDTDRLRIFKSHMDDWKNCKYNMAFAAYHENRVIGFSTAYKEKNHMYLRNLYVSPQYEGMGIGRTLLEKTEKAAALMANKIEVVPLPGAVSFYEARGYTHLYNSVMTKKLPKSLVGTIPVFKWSKSLCPEIEFDIDNSLLIHSWKQPIFLYVAPERSVKGVGMHTREGENIVWADENDGREMMAFYKSQLLKALSKVR